MKKCCKYCINPMGLNVVNPVTGKELKFYEVGNETVCEICFDIMNSGSLPSRKQFDEEFELFLRENKKILFAYSGGLDSTVVLAKLASECQKRSIELQIFTVDTKVKGRVAEENIENVLNFLNLKKNHFYVDVADKIQDNPKILDITGKPVTTLDVYKICREKGILPCGKICNTMIDGTYDSVMKDLGFTVMVTGGDTPKKNSKGAYSLFWTKPSGVTIVRGAYAFGLSKLINFTYITDHKIPWVHPRCGGYDTDCLIPGVFFAEGLNFQSNRGMEFVVAKYPIILDYLTERVRFGVINYEEALKMITSVDVSSEQSYGELLEILEIKSR
ncbi:MAG: ATP-binding protein [Candidatus Moranbacteria bacterium]|nr:ATP-binding protein [Candidatus Moranbacteria bacterium]MDX9856000.1 ATP-binding protein [Candidatus Moranbacteria bacterium]